MRKIYTLVAFLFVTTLAFAQENSKEISLEEEIPTAITAKENKIDFFAPTNAIIAKRSEDDIKVDAGFRVDPDENAIAVSNSKNLKMLYVASSLFYTHNYALT